MKRCPQMQQTYGDDLQVFPPIKARWCWGLLKPTTRFRSTVSRAVPHREKRSEGGMGAIYKAMHTEMDALRRSSS